MSYGLFTVMVLPMLSLSGSVAELLRRPGAEHDGRAVHHADAGERSRHGHDARRSAVTRRR